MASSERTYPPLRNRRWVIGVAFTGAVAAVTAQQAFQTRLVEYSEPDQQLPIKKDNWQRALIPNSEFIEDNKELLKHITLGANISAEQLGYLSEKKYHRRMSDEDIVLMFDYAHVYYGISAVRLSISWERTNPQKGRVDFSFDRKVFENIAQNNMKALPVVGIKRLWDPEFSVPRWVGTVPPKGATIHARSQVAQEFLAHLTKELEFLREFSNTFDTIQAENESFQEQTGELQWVMAPDYLEQVVLKILQQFPQKSVMLNGLETYHFEEIAAFLADMMKTYPALELSQKAAIGTNLFYMTPWKFKVKNMGYLPGINSFPTDTLLSLAEGFDKEAFRRNILLARANNIKLRFVSEMQAHGWPPITFAQDNPEFLKFMILESNEAVDPQLPAEFYIWGIEEDLLALKYETLNPRQEEKRELIARINAM